MTAFSVRRVVDVDLDDIYAFVCSLENETFDDAYFRDIFKYNILSTHNIYLIAHQGEVPAGFISCHGQTLLHHKGMVFEIQELFVAEAFRNQGAGKLLLSELQAIVSGLNCDSLEVSSGKQREDAHRFYLQQGFSSSHFKFTKKKL